MSIRAHEFVASVLHQLSSTSERGMVAAEEAFAAAGSGFLSKLPPPVDDLESTVSALREKFQLAFFIV
jgi:hypothetical protein